MIVFFRLLKEVVEGFSSSNEKSGDSPELKCSNMRMQKTFRLPQILILFILSMLFGCSAPYIPEEKKAIEPVKPETAYVRVAVAKNISTLHVQAKDLSLINHENRIPLPANITVTCNGDSVTINGSRYSTPVSLVSVSLVSANAISVNGKLHYGHLVIQQNLLMAIVPLDEYLKGVLSAEVPESWPIEALKAQAVVSRTFVYRRIRQNKNRPYDVEDTVMDQKFDYGESSPAIDQAVLQTVGRVILYHGEPIEAFFHSCSGGRTERSGDIFQKDLPYLRSVSDPYCMDSRKFFWSFSKTGNEIKQALREYIDPGIFEYNLRAVKIYKRTGSGRVREFLLVFDGNESMAVDGNRFRIALNPTQFKSLLVDSIRVERQGTDVKFTFQGRGYGHGVGMSQWGAYEMAMRGFNYPAIIAHYYRGTKIGFIWDIR